MMTVLITLTTAGSDTGPFNLLSNLDGFTVPFESSIAKLDLESGYTSYLVPNGTSTIRVQSTGPLCTNYIDLLIEGTTTTTTTTEAPTTTTTTTCGEVNSFINSGRGEDETTACSDASVNNRTFYSNCVSISVGCFIYVDACGITPLTGYSYIFTDTANWDINPITGQVLSLSAIQC